MNPKISEIYDEEKGFVKLGLCQVYTEQWDIEGNFQRTMDALDDAAGQGAEIAITPECVFHGYGAGEDQAETKRRCLDVAEALDSRRISAVCGLAREKKMHVVLGFAELGSNGLIYNSAALISSSGSILNIYRKVHCRDFERIDFNGAFTPGDRFVAADIDCGDKSFRMGTMICFDREIPESTRCLRAMGSHLVACPLATDTSPLDKHVNYAHNESITRIRAAENEIFIAVVNHSGRFNGGSFVVGPNGEVLIQLGVQAEVRVMDIPICMLAKKIHTEPYGWMGWGYRRQAVYDRHLGT